MLLDSRESRKRIASFQGLRHGNLAISSQQSRQKTTLAHWVRNSSRATIYADVDSEDLDGRADHLEKVFAALHVYLTAIIADTAHNVPGGTLDRRYLESLLRDLSADALGVIRNVAEDMREHENWRAS